MWQPGHADLLPKRGNVVVVAGVVEGGRSKRLELWFVLFLWGDGDGLLVGVWLFSCPFSCENLREAALGDFRITIFSGGAH